MRDDFAVFIITHGRPHNQMTLQTLRRGGYSGKLYFIVDDEDETKDEYINVYGEESVKIFHKEEWFDIGDNLTEHKGVPVYARNESFKIAEGLGLRTFLQLDDDYTSIAFRYDNGEKLMAKEVPDIDRLFDAVCDYIEQAPITCIAFGVPGDYIGGRDSKYKQHIYFNARNSFFCKTGDPFVFLGRVNEDVSTPAWHNSTGRLFITILDVMVSLYDHKKNSGGSTEQYKSFSLFWNYSYPVMYFPSGVRISGTHGSINKEVRYNNTVPKILSERWKK